MALKIQSKRLSNKVMTFVAVTALALQPLFSLTSTSIAHAADGIDSQAELVAAIADPTQSVINLTGSFTTTSQVTINRALTLNGNSFTISPTFAGASGNDAALLVTAPSTISNVVIEGLGASALQGVQVYKSSATITNVTIRNNDKAGLHANGSTVTVNNISTASNGALFGGILLDKGVGVTTNSVVTVNGESRHSNEWRGITLDGSGTLVDTNSQYRKDFDLFGLKIYTLKAAPAAPVVTAPAQNAVLTTSSATVSWTADTYANNFNVKIDGNDVNGVSGNSYNAIGLLNGAHKVQVQSVAKSGLKSAWSAERTFVVDANLLPVGTIATPVANGFAATKKNGNKLNITGTFTDDEAPNYLQLELVHAGNLVALGNVYGSTVASNGNFSYDMTVPTNVPDGQYSLFYTATDFENGIGPRTEHVFNIDNTRPQVSISNENVYNPANVTITATDSGAGVNAVTGNIYKYDENTASYKLHNSNSSTSLNPFTVDLSNLTDGKYYVRYNATDKVGNVSTTSEFNFTVDKTAPTATVTYSPATLTNKSVIATLTTSEPIVASALPGTWLKKSDTVYQKSYPANNTQSVTLTDLAGNTGSANVTITWIDKTAPVAPVITNSPITINNSMANAQATWSHNGVDVDHYEYREYMSLAAANADADGNTASYWIVNHPANEKTQTVGQSWTGEQTLYYRVVAIDAAGNRSTPSALGTVIIDKVGPMAVSLALPGDNAVVKGASVTQAWNASSSADVDYYIYESYNDAAATSLRWRENFTGTSKTATNVANATYWWRVTAVDKAGNKSTPSPLWKVTIDNNDPVVTLSDYTTNGNVITPVITATDASDLTYTWTGSYPDVAVSATDVLTPDFTVTTDGTYSYMLTVTDAAGNKKEQVFTFTYATPVVVPLAQPAAALVQTNNAPAGPFTNVALTQVADDAEDTPAVQGASTEGDDTDKPEILGTTATPESKDGDFKVLGLNWYWWLPILAAGGGMAWWLFALMRRNSED